MNNEMLCFFKAAYQNDPSCVLIIDNTRKLVWHNGKHPPFDTDEDLTAVLRMPESGSVQNGTYSYSSNGIMYEYHLTNVDDKYYIILCSDIPAIYKHLESQYIREHLENALAETKIETMRISAAAAQLNEYFEDFSDNYISIETLNEQTNIIMHSCSHILKKQYLLEELLRYYREDELSRSVLNCCDIIRHFSENCSEVIGPRGTTRISIDNPQDVFICASWKRMEYCLLCILITLRKKYSGVYDVNITACQIYDEAVINIRITKTNCEHTEKPPLLSEFIPLHKNIPTYDIENMIIRKFLEHFDGVLIDSTEGDTSLISLRFPAAEPASTLKLASPKRGILGKNIITPYHAILWEISDFRYY